MALISCAAIGERWQWPVGAKEPKPQSNRNLAEIEKAKMLIV